MMADTRLGRDAKPSTRAQRRIERRRVQLQPRADAPLAGSQHWHYSPVPGRGMSQLPIKEQIDIANSPWPDKTTAQLQAECATLASRVDHDAPPDLLPMAVMRRRQGILVFDEFWLQRVNGESARTERDRRMGMIMQMKQAYKPLVFYTLEARWQFRRSDNDIAAELGLSAPTVAKMILRFQQEILDDYLALYPLST